MGWTDTSRECDRREHTTCSGTVTVIDQDGTSRYICQCFCHRQSATCDHCGGGIHRQRGATWVHGSGDDKCPTRYASPAPTTPEAS